MAYRIEFKPSAAKQLQGLPDQIAVRIERAIDALALEPRPNNVKKLKGDANLWRVRVGDYRILYEIHDGILLVLVLRIGHRRDVYE